MPDMSTDHQAEPPPEVVAEQQAAEERAAAVEARLRPELERLSAEADRLRAEQDAREVAAVPSIAPQPAPLDLDAVERRAEVTRRHIGDHSAFSAGVLGPALDDMEALVAEVRRLRAELDDEKGAHAKTCASFDDFAEGTEGTAGQLRDARRQVETWRGRALGAEALLHNMGARRDADGAWQPPPAELDAAPATHQPSEKLIRDFTERVGLLREPDEDYSNEADARALLWWLLSQVGTPAPIACCSRVAGHDCDIHPSRPLSTVPPAGTAADHAG